MKCNLIFILLFIIPNISFAADPPAFTDQDLNQYKKAYDINKASEKPNAEENNSDRINALPGDGNDLQKQKGFEVPYKAYEGTARRVIIKVKFNDSVTAPLLLDTGAPGMMISYELADKLGLFHKDNARLITSVGGIGGNVPGIITIIDTVQIGKARDYFIPTTISSSLSDQFEGLIGMDFMSNYAVKIDMRKKVVVFEELPPRGNIPGGHDEEWWRINFRQFASLRSEWMKVKKKLDTWIDVNRNESSEVSELKRFIELQCMEADKLFDKLNGYAIRNSVPMEWREY
jgi:hypothetical protein